MTNTATTPRFDPGQILITTAAQQRLPANKVQSALTRHLSGDWGDCDPHDAAANDRAVRDEARLFSVYHTANQTKSGSSPKPTGRPRPSFCPKTTDGDIPHLHSYSLIPENCRPA